MREESAGHRTGAQPANLEVEGFSLLRTLSDRDRSKVFLARDRAGALAAVKLQLPADSRALPGILARYGRLQPLTTRRGLLPILSYGIASDGWLWESLPLADNLPGLPPLTEHAGLEQYTPVTLRTWTTEQGPASATQVAKWGIRLAGSLNATHEEGLVHRDDNAPPVHVV